MAKYDGKIAKRVADAWTYNKEDPLLWDGELKGFLLRANADGSKTWYINYENKYGQERRHKIGRHGELTPVEARKKAEHLLSRIRVDGYDPQEKKQQDKKALTVNDLLDLYLESEKFKVKADTTRYVDEGRIRRHIRPTLGKVYLENLKPEHVRKAFAAIRDGKTACDVKTKPRGRATVKGGEGAARMAIRVLRAILNWGIKEGEVNSNPAEKIDIGNDGNREVILETTEQYAALFKALDTLESRRQIPDSVADAIRVLALTGARRNEIAALKWSYVDLKRGFLVLPPKAHKTGHKSGKAKQIALDSTAQAIISNRPQGEPDDYVFPPAGGSGPISLSSKIWKLIRDEAGLPEGISNHSLRHSLGTLMAIQGAEAAQIMVALGHTQLSTVQRYLHVGKDARVALIEKHTAGIASALRNGEGKAEVIDMEEHRK